MEKISVTGVSPAVHEWPGKGPAIVCIHGLTANHTCWQSLADILAPDYRLIAYDLRGRGGSDKPPKGYSLEIHARDLLGLLDHFGLKTAIIMGPSLGAEIALYVAARFPKRTKKLILVDGGLDFRAEVFDSIAPAVNRLGGEFPSMEVFLQVVPGLAVP